MFRNTATAVAALPQTEDARRPAELIPLSVLELDLDPPSVGGWTAYLIGRASRSFSMTSADVRSPAAAGAIRLGPREDWHLPKGAAVITSV
jgi:hypothetical protein